MKPSERRPVKHVIYKPDKISKEYEKRFRAEAEFRQLTNKIRRSQEWIPKFVLENPDIKPTEYIKKLKERREKIRESLKGLRHNKVGEHSRMPFFCPDPFPPGFPPDRERIREFLIWERFIDRFRRKNPIGISESKPVEETSNTLTGLVWSYELKEYLKVFSYPPGDDPASIFTCEFTFDPYVDIHRGILGYKTRVESPDDYSSLYALVALTFEFPPAPFDGILTYEANTSLFLPYALNADEAGIQVNWVICEQPDANTAGPYNYDFDKMIIGPSASVRNSGDNGNRIEDEYIMGSFHVSNGVASRVHIGIEINIDVDDGYAGTYTAWGSLLFWRPIGQDYWGVKFTITQG